MLSKVLVMAEALRYPGGGQALMKSRPRSVTSWLMANRLRELGTAFQTILDGGANLGQFARAAHQCYPDARIISFEPLPDIAEQLEANLSDVERHFVLRSALGSYNGEIGFHRNSYSQSSSVLTMLHSRGGLTVGTKETEHIRVPIGRLDTLLEKQSLTPPALLKLDLQGYELEALKGATVTLQQCSHLLLETVFDREYEGEPLFEEIWIYLRKQGFHFVRPLNFSKGSTGSIVQMDALFRKL